jgi:pimeloyl-ACP methyl ester carboxylesterase
VEAFIVRRILRWLLAAAIGLAVLAVIVIAAFRTAAAWRETSEASQIAPASGRYVPTRSGRVFLQEAGPRDGVAVVLFHGTAAWSELWRQTMSALADAGFHAIAIDIPPFGFSDRPGNYTRRDQAERVHDILDQFAIPSAVIVGHSFGAGAATETVLRFPDRIRGLVLIDAALGISARVDGSSSPPLPLRSGLAREMVVALTITNPLATRLLLAQLIEKKERAANYVALLQQPMTIRNTTPDLAEWLLYFMSDDRAAMSADRKAYATVSARTAIIWGDKDTVTPLAQAEDLHSLIPAATFTLLPGLGHIPQIEDPDAFNRALVAQLNAMK